MHDRTQRPRLRWAAPIAAIAYLAGAAIAGDAPKVTWVKPPPSIEELTNGALKVGDKLDRNTLEAARHLLPIGMDAMVKKASAEWTIVATTPPEEFVPPPRIQKTLEYAGQQVITPEGSLSLRDGSPWPGGFPVLDPKTGIEVMVNATFQHGDTLYDPVGIIHWTDPAGAVYRTTYGSLFSNRSTGRVCVGPTPHVSGFESEDRRELFRLIDPYEVRGIALLTILYRDQTKLPDTWGYVPVLRRVQRLSTGQRYDSVDGSDIRLGDINVFNDPLGVWKFNLIKRAPLLSMVSERVHPRRASREEAAIPRIEGKFPKDSKIEGRDTFVVEGTPTDPSHIYSRKVFYIDAASYVVWYAAAFDRQGALWMGILFPQGSEDTPCGPFVRMHSAAFMNLQTGSGTFVDVVRESFVGSDKLNPNIFTMKYLGSQAR